MIPILATSAASFVGKLYDDITTKAADLSAQSAPDSADGVNFSTLLNHIGASNSAGKLSSAQSLQHAADFASQLPKSADLTAAMSAFGA
jgi:hypothetical protein